MSNEIKGRIAKEVKDCDESLQIITAFCKEQGMKFLDNNITTDLKEKRVLVRFRMEDIIGGATDLQLFDYCKENMWKLYIRFDLHAKAYIFDRKRCIIGSANLTNKGLNLSDGGNYEIANVGELETTDISKINRLFDKAILMNDELYQMMKEQVTDVEKTKSKEYDWSNDIKNLFKPNLEVLFTFDFPINIDYKVYKGKVIEFLDLGSNWTLDQLKETFRRSKVFLWLYTLLENAGGEMYFGEVTANLHNVLINDPKPYRKEVKELLQRLLMWIQDLEIKEISIDRPNHSQRIRLT